MVTNPNSEATERLNFTQQGVILCERENLSIRGFVSCNPGDFLHLPSILNFGSYEAKQAGALQGSYIISVTSPEGF